MRKLVCAVAALLPLVLAGPAEARGGMGGGGMGRGGGMGPGFGGMNERPLRDDLRANRDNMANPTDDPARCGARCRMSPEERQKLRQDIHDAGRDIYRRGDRRGPPPGD